MERTISLLNNTTAAPADYFSPRPKPSLSRKAQTTMHIPVMFSPDSLELLPCTTYVPPSPRGRLLSPPYVRPSLRLDHYALPSPEEILEIATRAKRSMSSSSASSMTSQSSASSTCSSRSEKRQGRIFVNNPQGFGGLIDLLLETKERTGTSPSASSHASASPGDDLFL